MAKPIDTDKKKILSEFETMKSYEVSASELYAQIAGDPRVMQPKIRDAFASLAKDERRHADLVREILDLVNKAL